jgi:hypothetical protein
MLASTTPKRSGKAGFALSKDTVSVDVVDEGKYHIMRAESRRRVGGSGTL